MSSSEVTDALLEYMPGALRTAVHVLVAATHRTAYNYDSAPCSPMTCIAKAAFVFTFMTYHTIAIVNRHDAGRYSPPASSFEHTVAVHGYTAPARRALMLALPSLVGLYHQQQLDSTEHAPDAVVQVVSQQLGS
jgi:heme/copper-type cytochrome/quinol oxidase subunit 2